MGLAESGGLCRAKAARWICAALLLAAVAVAAGVLWRQFEHTSRAAVAAAVRAQPAHRLVAALALTVLSFAALAFYDLLAVRTATRQYLPARVALLAGATANAISNSLGFHALTGSLVRVRIYGRHGLGMGMLARIVSLSWLAMGLGFLALVCAAEWAQWWFADGRRGVPVAAVGLLGALAAFVAWLGSGRRCLTGWGVSQALPSARSAFAQMVIGAVESAAAIGALYVLLPPDLAPAFSHFAVGCIAAVAVGVIAHVPGGVGVFEAAITALLGGAGRADLIGALLLYRLVYNLLPFALSVAVLSALGYWRRGHVSSTAGSG